MHQEMQSLFFGGHLLWSFFRASLGKFGRKSFAPPKICILLIGVARGAKGAMALPKFLKNIVILCFENRFSKQNSVNRLKSNILPPKIFGLATPLMLLHLWWRFLVFRGNDFL